MGAVVGVLRCSSLKGAGLLYGSGEDSSTKNGSMVSYEEYEKLRRPFAFDEPTREERFELQLTYTIELNSALYQARMNSFRIATKLQQGSEAYKFLVHGAGRRFIAIQTAIQSILEISPPSQDTPIGMNNVHKVSNDLNTIYINIRGLLDNYAWTLVELRGGAAALGLRITAIGLFDKRFWQALAEPGLEASIMSRLSWHDEMKERRDPAAHRIPLSVPPAVHNPTTIVAYREREAAMSAAQRRGGELALERRYDESQAAFAEANEIAEEMEYIGGFWPVFHHHPDEGNTPIYPTVPQDVAVTIAILGDIEATL